MIKQKGFAYIPIILIIIILATIGVGGYVYVKNQNQLVKYQSSISPAPTPALDNSYKTLPSTDGVEGAPVSPEEETELNKITTQGSVGTANWKTYKNEKYGFEFKYPVDWTINDKFIEVEPHSLLITPDALNEFSIDIDTLACHPTGPVDSLEEYLKCYSYDQNYTRENRILDSGDWLRFASVPRITDYGRGEVRYVFMKDKVKYEMILHWDQMSKNIALADKVMTTFKFTK